MKITFVICLHSTRIENLKQTIRLLEKKEPNLIGSELIINFHDSYDEDLISSVFNIKKNNLNLEIYNKPFMCNYGVNKASNEIVCILDSDRILPYNYFYQLVFNMKENDFITTKFIKECVKDETDEDLINGNFICNLEERSVENKINHKSLFSGNVVFFKKNYIAIGGMDETFIGYSFNDNDITQKVMSNKNLNCIFLNQYEIHLYHEKNFYFKSRCFTKEEKELHCVTNMLKFCNKWNIEINERYKEAKEYLVIANDMQNKFIRDRFYDEYNKIKFNLFV